MDITQVKRNLNKMVEYNGKSGIYKLTACVIRENDEYFYQAELLDTKHGNSVVIAKLEDVSECKQ